MGRLLVRRRERFSPADRWAIAILVVLPAAVDLPWAFAGRPDLVGDNLTQNYPLRVLAGELIRHGQLPLWNPDIWSGAPLLAGWNAGAMFPGTWLFALLPGVAAWEVNMVGTAVLAGVGMHLFLRRIGCSPLASLLGSLTFTYTGFMSGHSAHIGLFEGAAFAPWMLLALDWLVRTRATRFADTALPVALLGVSGGLVVLAGDPRAISNDAIVVGVYLIACCIRARRAGRRYHGAEPPFDTRPPTSAPRLVASVLAAAVLGAAVASVQWLPGLSYLHQSQRSIGSLTAFGAGSLHWADLGYFLVPFVYGGNGNFHMPNFAGSFNLPELVYGVGMLPLVALFVLSVRALRREASGVRVWIVMFLVGVVLSAGTNTPLGHLLVHVPLYGGERLQNRNTGISDLALSVLLAIFVDFLQDVATSKQLHRPVGAPEAPEERGGPGALALPAGGLPLAERLAGLVPPAAAIALVVAMYIVPISTQRLLGANIVSRTLPGRMTPYYVVVIVVALASAGLVLVRRAPRRAVRALAAAIVCVDVVVFIAMASYQPAPTAALAASNPVADTLAAAVGGPFGRVAIFNPQQLAVHSPPALLDDLGKSDLVIIHHLPSVQGYGSAVAARYEAATGTHNVENLRPAAFLLPTLDELDLRAIATLPELIGRVEPSATAAPLPSGPPRPAGTSPADLQAGDQVNFAPYPPTGPWRVTAGSAADFLLPGAVVADAVVLRFESRDASEPAAARVTLVLRDGATLRREARRSGSVVSVRFPAALVRGGGGAIRLEVAAPVAPPASAPASRRPGGRHHAAALAGASAGRAPVLGAVAVHVLAAGSSDLQRSGPPRRATWFALNGLLQGLLPPGRWAFDTTIGPMDVFVNRRADGAAWLEAPDARTARPGDVPGTVRATPTAEWQAPVDLVSTPRPALLVRSEQYAPGWTATVTPAGGSQAGSGAVTLPVLQVGLVQGVELPPGRWTVTWRYGSRRADAGLAAGFAALLATTWLVWLGARQRRRLRRAV